MPIVCYNKPNRTKIRHFTLRDAARIYCHVKEEKNFSGENRQLEIAAFELEFVALLKECEWTQDEWREKVQTIFDEVESILETLLKTYLTALEWGRITKRVFDKLPAPIQRYLLEKIDVFIKPILTSVEEALKVLRLPGPI